MLEKEKERKEKETEGQYKETEIKEKEKEHLKKFVRCFVNMDPGVLFSKARP